MVQINTVCLNQESHLKVIDGKKKVSTEANKACMSRRTRQIGRIIIVSLQDGLNEHPCIV
jgi:hypothetical protein